jgi:sporulation protein YlmC with PRC-barrel domain
MRAYVLLALAACGLWVAFAASAAPPDVSVDVNRNGVTVEKHGTQVESGMQTIVRGKDLTGLSVYNANNESLGKIEDLVIDPQAGKIRYAVLSFGGFLGMGDKLFAIPWQKLSFVAKGTTSAGTEKESYVVLNVSKGILKGAPGFAKDSWPNFADRTWRDTIEQHYGTSRQARGERNPQR